MVFSSWKTGFLSQAGAVQITLQLLLAMALALTPTRLYARLQRGQWLSGQPISFVALSLSALLLTLATGHPLGAGALCLVMDAWRKRQVAVSHPLDAAFSLWAITLGILLGEGQYFIAFMGTMLPSMALWLYTRFIPASQPGYLLIRLSFSEAGYVPQQLFHKVQSVFAEPMHQVFHHEHRDGASYGFAIASPELDLQQVRKTLGDMIPANVHLELQPVTPSAAMAGRWV